MIKQQALRVIRDFNKSPFYARIGNTVFVFSSDFNRRRFRAALADEKRHFGARCKKLYGLRVEYNAVSAFALYAKIERRGYMIRVRYGDGVKTVTNPNAVQIVADVHVVL